MGRLAPPVGPNGAGVSFREVTHVHVVCDGCEALAADEDEGFVYCFTSVEQARARLPAGEEDRAGWVLLGERAVCPDCQELGECTWLGEHTWSPWRDVAHPDYVGRGHRCTRTGCRAVEYDPQPPAHLLGARGEAR